MFRPAELTFLKDGGDPCQNLPVFDLPDREQCHTLFINALVLKHCMSEGYIIEYADIN